jgi:hypothetical protein
MGHQHFINGIRMTAHSTYPYLRSVFTFDKSEGFKGCLGAKVD